MSLSHPMRLMYYLPALLALGVAYMALGWLARWLAIPPGFAMAIFPPAGLALGAALCFGWRILPGIGLGSLLLNLSISSNFQISSENLLLSLCIACGAMLQAGLSAGLMRRFHSYPSALDNNRSILLFMSLAVLGCCINATCGITALWLFGKINQTELLRNLLTWWFGDALGVLTITPVFLTLFGQPQAIWRARRFNLLTPLLATLLMVVLSYALVREWEQKRMQTEFQDRAQRLVTSLQARLDYFIDLQKSVVSLFGAVSEVSPQQFNHFVAQPISNYAALQVIAWAPHLPHARRAEFESKLEGGRSLQSLDPATLSVRLREEQDEYFPVQYAAPLLDNTNLPGLDLSAHAQLRQAIADARNVGLPNAVIANSVLPGHPGQIYACLISPVFDSKTVGMSVAERRRAIQGVVLSILQLSEVLEHILGEHDRQAILVRFGDASRQGHLQVFYDSIIREPDNRAQSQEFSLDMGGRELRIQIKPTRAYQERQQAWVSWGTLVGGMLFASIVGMYLLIVSGRSWSIESLVQQRTMDLHASEQRLHLVLDYAVDGILSVDTHGRIQLANRGICRMLGFSADALQQQNFSSLFFPEGRSISLFELALKKHPTEVMGRRYDNVRVALELSVARVSESEEALFIVIVHDLSERKRVEQLKADFVSAVSHELRTPLTSIRGSLGLLCGGVGGQLPDQAAKLLRLANDNAERLALLINDLLDFEKLEYGGLQFLREKNDLRDILQQAIENNLGFAQKFNVHLQLEQLPAAPVTVLLDRSRMLQVMGNLLSNAIKFSPANGKVEIGLIMKEGSVSVFVQDHGDGISDSYKERVFEKFSQADSSVTRKYAGTGLGLSLTKMMVEKMDGEIGFDSIEGQGATFYVTLPTVAAERE
ncbi:MASE1 domain-containing protein [Massilia sp. W12]|uniref:MASE1 domain-containing protein n=1 Tax=Massilia sp. W12 TaxID=3126507 RepID=UPI0030D583BB